MPITSECLVTWWCGVLAKRHRSGVQVRLVQEAVYKPGRSTDAAPVVIPQCRYQPRAVGGEHQVGQGAFPERPGAVLTPGRSLFPSRLDQYVMPSRIQGHHRCTGENDVIGAGVEVPQPPGLA